MCLGFGVSRKGGVGLQGIGLKAWVRYEQLGKEWTGKWCGLLWVDGRRGKGCLLLTESDRTGFVSNVVNAGLDGPTSLKRIWDLPMIFLIKGGSSSQHRVSS